MNKSPATRMLKPLAALLALSAAACSPVAPAAPPSDMQVSASTRQQALALIEKDLLKQGTRARTYAGGPNDGWIEEVNFLKLEEVRTEPVKGGKHRLVCRETREIRRWKTYSGKKKGEPIVRMDESLHRYIF